MKSPKKCNTKPVFQEDLPIIIFIQWNIVKMHQVSRRDIPSWMVLEPINYGIGAGINDKTQNTDPRIS